MNKVRKGINTFSAYQEGKQSSRENIIFEYLKTLKSRKVSFKYVTQLAEMVAAHIAEAEKDLASSPCNVSTLLRNKRYKKPLLEFMAEQTLAAGYRDISQNGNSGEVVLIQSQLETVNLRNENSRLKKYIAELERQRPVANGSVINSIDAVDVHSRTAADGEEFFKTCMCLFQVLKAFGSYVKLDDESGAIIDPAIRRGAGKIIVAATETGPYREWLKKNRFLQDL